MFDPTSLGLTLVPVPAIPDDVEKPRKKGTKTATKQKRR